MTSCAVHDRLYQWDTTASIVVTAGIRRQIKRDENVKRRPVKRIISIKGGGIRGIIPCCHLVELERQTGKLTREVIDFAGGTSTGALLAACVVAGVPASSALEVYTQQGRTVFAPANHLERDAILLATGHKFDNKVLHQVVLAALGNTMMTMNDSPIGV